MRRLHRLAATVISLSIAASAARAATRTCMGVTDVGGLGLVEKRSPTRTATLGVIVTGDGGWRAIDQSIANALLRNGVDVVGLVSPKYFRQRKTPDEAGCALERIVRHYSIAWRKNRVVLFGYSRGAGVLPFMLSRLPDREAAEVSGVALISLDPTIAFKYTPRDLVRRASIEHEISVFPEIEKLHARVFCVYGVSDKDALCRRLPLSRVIPIPLPGGHHPRTDYEQLVRRMLSP